MSQYFTDFLSATALIVSATTLFLVYGTKYENTKNYEYSLENNKVVNKNNELLLKIIEQQSANTIKELFSNEIKTLQETNDNTHFLMSLYNDTTDVNDIFEYIVQRLVQEGKNTKELEDIFEKLYIEEE